MSAAVPVQVYGTSPIKRVRRTRDQVDTLDAALLRIVSAIRPATVRQTFYQAEVAGLVPKDEAKGYRVVQRRLVALRQSGRLDYSAIVDNIRWVQGHTRYDGADDFAGEVASLYRRDYWSRSPVRVEVWIEKDALAAVLFPTVVEEWGLDLYVSRGFASLSYIENAALAARADGRPLYVYILSDLDPSGVSLARTVARDLPERAKPVPVHVQRIAVTPEQVVILDLPTRPTKATDSRAKAFVREFGPNSVELDAIAPGTLRSLVSATIEAHADTREIEHMKLIEQQERLSLTSFMRAMQ